MTGPARFNSRRARQAIRGGRDTGLDICSDPAFATHLADPLTEPRKIASFWRNRQRREEVRITLSRYEGRPVVSVWVFFTTQDGRMQPSKKGLVLAVSKLPELRKALEKAETMALELDLIEAVS
ncbi:transcriptional coactivator p15/PC4 family protein [Bradyrhizobium sp. ISRA442]|uniref:transcriptional coactivator p15/PC4 family protein n=1 Tax=Bradyrhizobium sp. ISRA442 TaxID=2866197 RepID=UPI00311AD3FB